uniref:Uncharacterized protein n=1 Tax=Panagrolaimus davidi TaxID=227884 RepID=A0A914QQE7_9BILA
MDYGNPLKELETFINNSSLPPPPPNSTFGFTTTTAFTRFDKSHQKISKDENYRNNFHILLDSTELQLEDFLENYDSQQEHFFEEYENTESNMCKMEEYSPQSYQPNNCFQQTMNFNNFNKSTLDEMEQQRQRKRNEEIARILSPIQKLKKNNKQNSTNSATSNLNIRRKFSLLNGPCNKKKTQPKPTKYSSSMKEWQEKIIPIIQQVSFKTEL